MLLLGDRDLPAPFRQAALVHGPALVDRPLDRDGPLLEPLLTVGEGRDARVLLA